MNGKKLLSLLLSLIMIISMFSMLFSIEVSAATATATAGTYYWRARVTATKADANESSMDYSDWTVYGKANNGTGTESTIYGTTTNKVTSTGTDVVYAYGDSTSFPTKLTYKYEVGGGMTAYNLAMNIYLDVSSDNSNWTNIGSTSLSGKSGWFNEFEGTVTITVADSYYPYPNSIAMSKSADNITTNANGGAGVTGTITATPYDQYGVVWGASAVTMTTSTTYHNGSWNNVNELKQTFTANPPTQNCTKGTATVSASVTGNSHTATGSATINITPTYKINYNYNGKGGTNGSDTVTNTSTSATTVSTTARTPSSVTGYTFLGWYTAATGGTRVCGAGESFNASYVTNLYAHWTPNRYAIYFNANNGYDMNEFTPTFLDGSVSGVDYSYDPETNVITLNGTATADGHIQSVPFTAYEGTYKVYITQTGGSISASSACAVFEASPQPTSGRKNVDFTGTNEATWTISETDASEIQYLKIWFWANSGSGSLTFNNFQFKIEIVHEKKNVPQAKTVTYDSTYGTLPTPVRDGYTFTGWYNGSTKIESTTKVNITATTTLTAHWTQNNYTVKIQANGATNTGDITTNATFDSTSITLPTQGTGTNQFQRKYNITYNYDNAEAVKGSDSGTLNLTGDTAGDSAEYTLLGFSDTNSYTYTQKIFNTTQKKFVTKTYSATDFSGPYYINKYSDIKNAFGGNKYNLINHYSVFTELGTETRIPYGSDKSLLYDPGFTVTNVSTTNGDTVNLVAQWESASVTLPTPVLTDDYGATFTFDGWYSDAAFTNKVGDAGDTYTPTASLTLYAKFSPKIYLVKFIDGNGNTVKSESVWFGRDATPPTTAPTKTPTATVHYVPKEESNNGWGTAHTNITSNKDIVADFNSESHDSYLTETVSETAPTCTDQGTTVKKCSKCGTNVTSHPAALGHNTTSTPGVAATCTTTGTKSYVYCSQCSTYYTTADCTTKIGDADDLNEWLEDLAGGKIAELGHVYTNYVYQNDALCGENGTEKAFCDHGCGTVDIRTAEGTALEHRFETYIYDGNAGCTDYGTKTAFCANGCGETDTIQDTDHPAQGHDWIKDKNGDVMWFDNNDSTCTSNGTELRYCLRCGLIEYRNKSGEAPGHTATIRKISSAENVLPTCTTAGGHWAEYYCSKCKSVVTAEYEDEINEAGYTYTSGEARFWVVDAALNHSAKVYHEAVAKTCETAGNSAYYWCPDCGKYFAENGTTTIVEGSYIISASHGEAIHTPAKTSTSCTDIGNIEYWFCPDCEKYFKDEDLTEEVTEAQTKLTGTHEGEETITATVPDCTTDGIIDCLHCTVCGYYTTDDWYTLKSYDEVKIKALGHDFQNYTYNNDATCSANGTQTGTCSRCDATDTIEAPSTQTAHVFETYNSDGNATCMKDGTKTASCIYNCGETDTKPDVGSKIPHSFTNYQDNDDYTCTKNGHETAVCDYGCGTFDTREIANSARHRDVTHVPASVPTDCESAGNIEYWYCGVCKKYFSDEALTTEITQAETIVARAHVNPQHFEAVPETCTTDGNIEYWYCSNCGSYATDSKFENLIHQADTVIKKHHTLVYHEATDGATCTDKGTVAYWECTACGKYFTDENATVEITDITTPAEHKGLVFHEAKAGSDCVHTGTIAYWECTVCGKLYDEDKTVEITADDLESDYGPHSASFNEKIAPNCLTNGFEAHYYCAVCRCYFRDADFKEMVSYEDLLIPSTGEHGYEWTTLTEATCSTSGLRQGVCTGCGLKIKAQIAPLGHDFGEWVASVVATCEQEGRSTRTCTRCGETESKKVDKLKHVDEDNDGICDSCRTILTYIPLDSDDFIEDSNFRCSRCDWYEQNKDKAFTGFFVTFIHFIVHYVQWFGSRF